MFSNVMSTSQRVGYTALYCKNIVWYTVNVHTWFTLLGEHDKTTVFDIVDMHL